MTEGRILRQGSPALRRLVIIGMMVAMPPSRRPALMTAMLLTLSIVAYGCSSPKSDQSRQGNRAQTITVVEPDSRKPGPLLEGTDLSGEWLSSADYAGKVLVVNLWGPWCGPCRAEAPMLRAVSDRYAERDVQFLGIVNDSGAAEAIRFNSRFKIDYPNFADQGGRLELGFAKNLPTQTVPTTWIIDARGQVAVRIMEPRLTESTLSGLIDDVLAEKV